MKLFAIGIVAITYGAIALLSDKIFLPKFSTLVAILSLTLTSYLIRGVRWKMLLNRNNVKIDFFGSLSTFLAGLAFVITPGKVGEVAKAELMKDMYKTRRKKIVFLTLIERAFDMLANLTIAFFTGILVAKNYLKNISILLLLFLLSLISLYVFRKKLRFIEEEISSLGDVKLIISTFALSLIAWGIEGVEVILLAKNFGSEISVAKALFAFSFSLIAGNITMLPGGIGGAEASLIALLSLFNIEKDVASAITLAVRFSTLWFGFFLGSAIWLYLSKVIKEKGQ